MQSSDIDGTMRALITICLLCLFAGCSFQPHFERPCVDTQPCWRFDCDESSTCANDGWWKALGDPVLDELIILALKNNRDLRLAAARVCAFAARFEVARSPLFPQLELSGSGVKERIPAASSTTGVGFITPFYTYAFNLSYEIDFWGQLRSQADAAYAQFLESIENRRTVVLSLVGAVAEAYILLRELDRELEIALKTLEERREYLRLAIIRFKGGLTSEIESTQAAASLENALADVTLLEERIPQVENLISLLIGVSSTTIVRGKEIDSLELPYTVCAGTPCEILTNRPDILAAELKLAAANADIGAARAAFFPQISLLGLFGGESFQFKNLFNPIARAWQIGASFAQPLFTGGALTGKLHLANSKQEEAIYFYQQTVLNAFKEVNDALISYRQSQELVHVQEGNVEANEAYLRLSWLRYYDGQTDYLTVLDAETRLFEAQITLAQAQGNVFLSLIRLYKSLGGRWVEEADTIALSCSR